MPSKSLSCFSSLRPDASQPRFLTALPVYNEVKFVNEVLDEVVHFSPHVLVVNDGSTDGTGELLEQRIAQCNDIRVVEHTTNRGYGAALRTAFEYAARHQYELIVTIDCDGQHQPQRIPNFVTASCGADIVSGSRYLRAFAGDSVPPSDRRWINQQITKEINHRLGLRLTDAFCGFKAYRVSALRNLRLTDDGYAMPLELWVQAACGGLRVVEVAVPLIYLDEERSFGGSLDDSVTRLDYYHRTLNRAIRTAKQAASRNGKSSRCQQVSAVS